MNIVSYHDNDAMNKLDTGEAHVYAVSSSKQPVTKDELIRQYPQVFGDGVGCLEGEYHIRVDQQQSPVQHPPRKVPVALRDRLKASLDDLEKQDIVAPVTEPTPWVSSIVVVPKKDSKLRLCLDPKDLNKAIQREHYPLPTIEEVAPRLHGAKCFTILDAKSGFWHVRLDQASSVLTTFNTPFGYPVSLDGHLQFAPGWWALVATKWRRKMEPTHETGDTYLTPRSQSPNPAPEDSSTEESPNDPEEPVLEESRPSEPPSTPSQPVRRSPRARKEPDWFIKYAPTGNR